MYQKNGIEEKVALTGVEIGDLETNDMGLNAAMKGLMRRAVGKANTRHVSNYPPWSSYSMRIL